MPCQAAPPSTELDFVLALHTRHRKMPACCGPLLTIEMSPWRVFTLEQIFDSEAATELLWEGHHDGQQLGTSFSLCGGHWLDLAALVWMRSQEHQRTDWYGEADQLLQDVCTAAHWDPKEIINMFRWQGTRLT